MSEGADSFALQNAEQPNGMIFTTRKGTTDAQNIARRPKLGRRVLNRIRCDAAARSFVFERANVKKNSFFRLRNSSRRAQRRSK